MKKQITIEVDIPDGYEYAENYPELVCKPKFLGECRYACTLVLKKSEPKRWRADEEVIYFVLDVMGDYYERTEFRNKIDDDFYKAGNYFKNRFQALEASKRVKEVLLAYQQELMGE